MEAIGVKLGVVIVAGGSGNRMGAATPKQFMFLGQLPILAHSINSFAAAYPSCEIVVVLPSSHLEYWRNLAGRFAIAKHKSVEGGSERFYSSKAGIEALSESVDVIAVHDGARPLVCEALIKRATQQAASDGSAVPVIELFDAVREVDSNGVSRWCDRAAVRVVQTPQCFDAVLLRRAYRVEWSEKFTDDASVVESIGEPIFLCEGDRRNIKVTTPTDMSYAQFLIDERVDDEAQI